MNNFGRKLENIGAGMEPMDPQHISKKSKPLARPRSADAASSLSGQLPAPDEFGFFQPQLRTVVVAEAERTFRAMPVWFGPFCAGKGGQP
jgi:hypothetical protein